MGYPPPSVKSWHGFSRWASDPASGCEGAERMLAFHAHYAALILRDPIPSAPRPTSQQRSEGDRILEILISFRSELAWWVGCPGIQALLTSRRLHALSVPQIPRISPLSEAEIARSRSELDGVAATLVGLLSADYARWSASPGRHPAPTASPTREAIRQRLTRLSLSDIFEDAPLRDLFGQHMARERSEDGYAFLVDYYVHRSDPSALFATYILPTGPRPLPQGLPGWAECLEAGRRGDTAHMPLNVLANGLIAELQSELHRFRDAYWQELEAHLLAAAPQRE